MIEESEDRSQDVSVGRTRGRRRIAVPEED
jgi:hypothetical protein